MANREFVVMGTRLSEAQEAPDRGTAGISRLRALSRFHGSTGPRSCSDTGECHPYAPCWRKLVHK